MAFFGKVDTAEHHALVHLETSLPEGGILPGSIPQGQQHSCDSFTLLACTGVNERNESPCPVPQTLLVLKQELKGGKKKTFFLLYK